MNPRKHHARLTDEQAQEIRRLSRSEKLRQVELAALFHTTQGTISRVLAGHVHSRRRRRKLTDEQVQAIRYRALAEPLSQVEIAQEFGLAQSEVWKIIRQLTYRDVPPSRREVELRERVARLDGLRASLPEVD